MDAPDRLAADTDSDSDMTVEDSRGQGRARQGRAGQDMT
jgi:hypothetical protein